MDKIKQRLAIANISGRPVCNKCHNAIQPDICHCGEDIVGTFSSHDGHNPIPMGCVCGYIERPANSEWNEVPDYLNDLNAMSSIINKLKFSEKLEFISILQQVISAKLHGNILIQKEWALFSSADQQAEAYLKLKGKWEEC